MTEPIIVRASSLPNWPDCERRAAATVFRRDVEAMGYVLNDRPGSIGGPIGSGVHAGARRILDHKIRTGEPGPLDDATDAAVETLRELTAPGFIGDREAPDLNAAETHVVRMTRTYREQVAPQVQPTTVEERLEADAGHGIVLTGQADVIAREPGQVRDLKTGKSLGNYRAQIGAYSLLARSNGIADIQSSAIDFIQRGSLKKPQPDAVIRTIPVAEAETAAVNVLRRMGAAIKVFREGDERLRLMPGDPWAFLANPSSMLCSAKWCRAWGTDFCREHAPAKEETE